MPRTTDAREKTLDTAERLFRNQGYAATGLTQILDESGAPKGSYYHHFPGGKAQMAEEALALYAARAEAAIAAAAARAKGDPAAFARTLAAMFAREMEASDWTLGCMVQNLAGELAPMDADWSARLDAILDRWIKALAAGLGGDRGRATALLAALEGARTLARVARSKAPFTAVAEAFGG